MAYRRLTAGQSISLPIQGTPFTSITEVQPIGLLVTCACKGKNGNDSYATGESTNNNAYSAFAVETNYASGDFNYVYIASGSALVKLV